MYMGESQSLLPEQQGQVKESYLSLGVCALILLLVATSYLRHNITTQTNIS